MKVIFFQKYRMPAALISYASQVLNIKFELKDSCEFCFCTAQHLNLFKIQKTHLLYLVGFLRVYLTQFIGVDSVLCGDIPIFKNEIV